MKFKLLKLVMKESEELKDESVVTRTAAEEMINESDEDFKAKYAKSFNAWKKANPNATDKEIIDILKAKQYNGELTEENISFEEIIRSMENAESYEELYSAAENIANVDLKDDVIKFIQQCENDGDSVEEAYSIVTTDLLDDKIQDLNEDAYITINDGKKEDEDYLIQDVTELKEIEDGDTEAPSIEGLLSLVNESLSNKYGDAWGYMKSKSIAIKENLQYAIIDIVTPSILKETAENKSIDRMISKTVILESVPNSKSMVNLKINTLAGTTRFSQKTREPAKVLTRWLESEYLYDEMVKDFQDKLAARVADLKSSTESYLKQHPDLKLRIETIKAQEKMLKDAGMLDESKEDIARLAYAIAAEFPANVKVKGNKDNEYEMEFDTIDEIVKLLFGESYVKEITKEEKDLAKQNKKVLKDNSLKEGYESFKIGEIEGVFNPSTGEAMYSIPSKNIADKKINLEKIQSVETPYDTDTIIKDYIEKNYGTIDTISDTDVETEPEPIEKSDDIETATDDETVDVDIEDNEELEEDVQSETGSASFYKIRQRENISINSLLDKTSSGANAQESEYIVVKEIDLSDEEMNNLLSNLSAPQTFLQGIEPVDRKNYAFNVVKVKSASSPYTLLIDNVGYDYPRYISIQQ